MMSATVPRMPTQKLTTAAIRRMPTDTKIFDTDVIGFGCRRQKRFAIFFVQTRFEGQQKFITIGKFGSPWTVADARNRALQILGDFARGVDIASKRDHHKANPTIQAASENYLKEHGAKLAEKTLEEYTRIFRLYVNPVLGHKKVNAVTHSDISKLHADMSDKKRAANHTLAVLNNFFNWCARANHRPKNTNPCEGLTKYKENKRQRFLTLDEFTRLGAALDDAAAVGDHNGIYGVAAIRLLVFTGCRKSEITTLKWDYVDFQRSRLFLPKSKTGEKTVLLNEAAIAVLKSVPRQLKCEYVFPAQTDQTIPFPTLQRFWQAVRDNAGLPDVTIHAFRHTYVSTGLENDIPITKVQQIVGHSSIQTTMGYAHLTQNAMHPENQTVGNIIDKAMSGKKQKH